MTVKSLSKTPTAPTQRLIGCLVWIIIYTTKIGITVWSYLIHTASSWGLELIQMMVSQMLIEKSHVYDQVPSMVCYHMCQNSNYPLVTWSDSICDVWRCDISWQSPITFHHLGKFEYWYSPNYHHITDTFIQSSFSSPPFTLQGLFWCRVWKLTMGWWLVMTLPASWQADNLVF